MSKGRLCTSERNAALGAPGTTSGCGENDIRTSFLLGVWGQRLDFKLQNFRIARGQSSPLDQRQSITHPCDRTSANWTCHDQTHTFTASHPRQWLRFV